MQKVDFMGQEHCLSAGGVPVYLYSNPCLHSFCLALYIKGGALYEKPEENGITHFWEHMVFRKLNHLLDNTLYQRLDRMGLDFTGCTYREFVQLKITGSPVFLEEAIRLMLLVFAPLALPASLLDTERRRVKAEIREEDERRSLEYFSNQIVWAGSPVAQSIAGTPSVLNRTTLKRLSAFQEQLLTTDNLFFYVTGCADQDSLAPLLAGLEALSLPHGKSRLNLAPVPAEMYSRKPSVHIKHSQYCFVRVSFDVDADGCSNAMLDLLYDVLFSGESCLLFQELSEKTGLIYSYDARFERFCNVGSLYFQYEVSQRNLLESVRQLSGLLNRLRSGLTDGLDRVRAPYTYNAGMLLDDVEDLNWSMAYECHILQESYRSIPERRKAYEAVTVSDMEGLLKKLIRPENMVVALKGSSARLEKMRAELEELIIWGMQ